MTVYQFEEKDIAALNMILEEITIKGARQAHYLAAAGDMLKKGKRVEIEEKKEEKKEGAKDGDGKHC